jgi:hypothetical protein
MDLDLNIENYEFKDILSLFKLEPSFTNKDLKDAKKMALKTHPDKSGLDKEIFEFFLIAYKRLEKVYEFREKRKQNLYDVDYDKNTNDITNEGEKLLLEKAKKKENFNEWFNGMFEDATENNKKSKGYGSWFKSDKDLNKEKANSLNDFGRIFNERKRTGRELTIHKGIEDIEMNSGGYNLNKNTMEAYRSTIFSKLQYEDLKTAHTETVVPVTMEDFTNRPLYGSVDEIVKERERNIPIMSIQESKDNLNRKYSCDSAMASHTAYDLIRQDEEAERSNKSWWKKLKQLSY